MKLHASEITGSLNISGSITPNGSGSFDLGSANAPWKDIHVMSSSIHVYDAAGPIAKLGAIRGKGFEFKDHAGALTRISGSAMKLTGNASIAGTVTSGEFVGGGAGLTGVTAEWDGTHTGNGNITGHLTIGGDLKSDSFYSATASEPIIFNMRADDGIQVKDSSGNVDVHIQSDGKVGIGTASPVDTLQITSPNYDSTTNDPDYFKALKLQMEEGQYWAQQAQFKLGRWESVAGSHSRSSLVIALAHADVAESADADVDVITFRSDGNIGIGTTSPSSLLHIKGSTPDLIVEDSSGGTNSGILKFKKLVTSSAADDDAVGEIDFRAYNDANEETLFAYITGWARDVSNGTEDGEISFYTMGNGSIPARMTITSDKVGIGTMSPGKTLDIVGTFRVSSDTFLQSHTYLPDNKHLYLGTGADSSIVQTGSVMKINNTAGNMELQIDGTTALTLADTTGNATFTGTIDSGAITSTGQVRGTKVSISGNAYFDESVDDNFNVFGASGVKFNTWASSQWNNVLTLDTSKNATFTGDVIVTGGLTINGTTTTINSTTLSVDDKNIELGSVATPSDTTADGGGITLKGSSDKTILWTNSTDTWDFNQGIKITSGNSTFAGTVTSPSLISTSQIISGDNMFIGGGQFYLGGSGASTTTHDTWRLYGTSGGGDFIIAQNVSGTWTNRLVINTTGLATFVNRVRINGSGAGTYNNSLELNNAGSVPTRIFVNNTGSTGYTGADIVLQTHHGARGAGIYTYNTADDRGWYMGTPYGQSGEWHLCYESTATFDVATAETAHSVFYINSSGSVFADGHITTTLDLSARAGTFSTTLAVTGNTTLAGRLIVNGTGAHTLGKHGFYYGTISNFDSDEYFHAFKVTGGQLNNVIKFSLKGTSNNHLHSHVIDIQVNHYKDIQVKSWSGNYNQVIVKVISDDNENFDVELKSTVGGSYEHDMTLEMNVQTITPDTAVAFGGSSSYSGTTHTHTTKKGTLMTGIDGTTTGQSHF